ncbi:MAG TPA: hypothetical protein VGC54_00780, partial [Planctomycetota bacterium]
MRPEDPKPTTPAAPQETSLESFAAARPRRRRVQVVRIAVPLFAAFLFGATTSGSLVPAKVRSAPYLMDLHIHGSLSERTATMAHHTSEAQRFGYDGLWWTDHMTRQVGSLYQHAVGFDGSLAEEHGKYLTNEFVLAEDQAGVTSLTFHQDTPAAGSAHVRARMETQDGSGWAESRLRLESTGAGHVKSLFAGPEPRIQVRLTNRKGEAAFLIRITLSSRSDGVSAEGTPNVLEYLPAKMHLPDPPPNVERIEIPKLRKNVWTSLVLPVTADARTHFWEGRDLALLEFELVLLSKKGGIVEMDFDDFSIELTDA